MNFDSNIKSGVSSRIEYIGGVEIPVKRICYHGRCSESNSLGHAKLAFWDYPKFDFKKYTKALYIEQCRENVYAVYGCYNFVPTNSRGTSYRYDVIKIKYDDSDDEYKFGRWSYVDDGPKGDRLNSMNRTWYEND